MHHSLIPLEGGPARCPPSSSDRQERVSYLAAAAAPALKAGRAALDSIVVDDLRKIDTSRSKTQLITSWVRDQLMG